MRRTLAHYGTAVALVTVVSVAGRALRDHLAQADLAMMFVLAVVIVAHRSPRGPALFAAALSVAAFDFFFVQPLHTFAVREIRYLITFAALLIVGVAVSGLTARLKERERAANEARLLVEAERVRNALLNSVSHDLRTPLGSILGAASALERPGLDDHSRRELADTICEEAGHLQCSLDNLLQMTRVGGDSMRIRKDWNVPEEVVGGALRRLSRQLRDRRVEVAIDSRADLANFDGLLIEQVLVNFVDNSAKYGDGDGRIWIRVTVAGDELVWEVSDDGPGLRPGDESRVFDKFERAASAGNERGTGLGLAIAKAIVESHGGRIWGRNRDDAGGAVFGFSLPMDRGAPSVPAEVAE